MACGMLILVTGNKYNTSVEILDLINSHASDEHKFPMPNNHTCNYKYTVVPAHKQLHCWAHWLTLITALYALHRPPKVWHHLEHKRHARVLIPTLKYLLSMIITNWDYSVIISSYMYMNCVFEANLNDNEWVYVLQGHVLNWLKIIANLTKIDSLHSWP